MLKLLLLLLLQVVTLFLLLIDIVVALRSSCSKLLLYSSCLMCYCAPLSWPATLLLLFNQLFCSFYLMLVLLLLDMLWCSSCSTCYSIFLVRPATLLASRWCFVFFALRYYSFCSTLLFIARSSLGTFMLRLWFYCFSFLLFNTIALTPLVSNWSPPPRPPFTFLQVWKNCLNLSSSIET